MFVNPFRWFATLTVVFLLLAVLPGAFGAESLAPVSADAFPALHSLTSDAAGVSFQVTVPTYTVDDGTLHAPGAEARVTAIGAPAVPYVATLVAVPPGATVTAEFSPARASVRAVPPIQPVPDIADYDAIEAGDVTRLEALGTTYRPDGAIYNTNAFYPAAPYTVSDPMIWRDLRVVEVRVFPLQYNPVSGQIAHTPRVDVALTFDGALTAPPAPAPTPLTVFDWEGLIVNAADAQQWRSRVPAAADDLAAVDLPLGQDVYKIEVDGPGVYEMTRDDLAAAGMDVLNVDPNTLEMMVQGETVAYTLVNDNGDDVFDAGERVRFYGYPYDGSRLEQLQFNYNVFWIWAGGSATRIQDGINPTGQPAVTMFRDTVVREEENTVHLTWNNDLTGFEADPDYFWFAILNTFGGVQSYPIELPHVAPGGGAAELVVEVQGRKNEPNHEIEFTLNSADLCSRTFDYRVLIRATCSIPAANVLEGTNELKLAATSAYFDYVHFNLFEVTYDRLFVAASDVLHFNHDARGEFLIDGFTNGSAADAIVWNITNPAQPTAIPLAPSDVTGSGPYTYRVATNEAGEKAFVAAAPAATLAPVSISQYVGSSIEPAGMGATWLAIVHPPLRGPVEALAQHRSAEGHMTHVVDTIDIFNQYGYGLPLAEALDKYVEDAFNTWPIPPAYLLLAGDASNNPRGVNCGPPDCSDSWLGPQDTNDVPAFYRPVDRFQGFISADYEYALAAGDDDLPDIAVGRLPARTVDEMQWMVDKTIGYEASVAGGEAWLDTLLFLADDADGGGNFCFENSSVANGHVPGAYNTLFHCLDNYVDGDTMRAAMKVDLDAGAGITNYRGHGGIQDWTNDGLLDVTDLDGFYGNVGRPTVMLSLDCLDGEFGFTNRPGLGESGLKFDNRGTVAHFSSAGLGYTFEHTVYHEAIYDALYDHGINTIGAAVFYAKSVYFDSNYDRSELYGFNLQADPALRLQAEPTPVCEADHYFSLSGSGNAGGFLYGPEDVLGYDSVTDDWCMLFDGAAAGLGGNNIDAFVSYNGDYLLSISEPASLPGLNNADDADVIIYRTASGLYQMVIDGSDVGLDVGNENEDIDALSIAGNTLAISTRGNVSAQGFTAAAGDAFRCTSAVFGPITSCTWSMYLDASDFGVPSTYSMNAMHFAGTDAYASFAQRIAFLDAVDLGYCGGFVSGDATSCTTLSLYLDGTSTAVGLHESADIDALWLNLGAAPAAEFNLTLLK